MRYTGLAQMWRGQREVRTVSPLQPLSSNPPPSSPPPSPPHPRLTNGVWQHAEKILVEVEIGEVPESIHGDWEGHQMILRGLKKAKIFEVANLLVERSSTTLKWSGWG